MGCIVGLEVRTATDAAMSIVIVEGIYQLATAAILGVCAILCCVIIGKAISGRREG